MIERSPAGSRAILLASAAVALAFGTSGAGEGLGEARRLYQEGDLTSARRIAAEHSSDPAGRLVLHLCRVHDAKDQDIAGGLAGLKALYEQKSLKGSHPHVWAEAALSYARVIQLLRERKLHTEYDRVDVRAVYRDIIASAPTDVRACTGLMYLAETHLRSKDRAVQDEGFRIVEEFLAGHEGRPENAVPVHQYVEGYYVVLRGDYRKSFAHLKAAYEIGIPKEMLKRLALFRMARTCEVKLGRPEDAKRYYRLFLRDYPNDRRTPVARRYLEALEGPAAPAASAPSDETGGGEG